MENTIGELYNYLIDSYRENINLDDLSNEFYYDKFYLVKAFKEYTGYTIIEFVNMLRVYNSIDPLLDTDDTILKIALQSGYSSQEYYSEKFKNIIGMSPVYFRKGFGSLEKIVDINEYKRRLNILNALKESRNKLNTRKEGNTRQRVA